MKLIFDGDSWTFGCEIVDPSLRKKYPDWNWKLDKSWYEENDEYRTKRIYPYFMSQALDCDYVNLSWTGDDNRTILERTMTFLSREYITKGKSTDDLFVIIGWSSPERNSFWWKSKNLSLPFILRPNIPDFKDPKMKDIWELYVQYMWHAEEYLPRHVSTVVQFQNFCNVYNIKWLCFDAFYHTPDCKGDNMGNLHPDDWKSFGNLHPTEWEDINMLKQLEKIDRAGHKEFVNGKRQFEDNDYKSLWNTVDPVRFYKKDQPNNTFRSFIQADTTNLIGWHPSPIGHELWANELLRYIKENSLL